MVYIRSYYTDGSYGSDYIRADQPPYVMFLGSPPDYILWTFDSSWNGKSYNVPYSSGMTITMRSREIVELGLDDDDLIGLLKSMGWISKYGELFAKQDFDYQGVLDLTDADMTQMGLPVGAAKKLRREINKRGGIETKAKEAKKAKNKAANVSGDYDLFLSHKQINGADLAQSIKLQLEVINPDLHIFLDVDDLNNLHILDDNVKNSKNFLLLLTEGVLERPWVQFEIKTAMQQKKNIILVHDERNCRFPSGEALEAVPEDVRAVLQTKAIPYYREKAFRDTSIRQVLEKMVGI